MSKNATDASNAGARPTRAIDTPESTVEPIDLDDQRGAFVASRPDWMTDDTWATIKGLTIKKIDQLVAAARDGDTVARLVNDSPDGGCSEHPWCIMGTVEEHLEYHAGNITDLSAATGAGLVVKSYDEQPKPGGWWCWPFHDRDAPEAKLSFEGHWHDGSPAEMFDVPVLEVAAILRATRTKEGRQALEQVVAAIWEAPDGVG